MALFPFTSIAKIANAISFTVLVVCVSSFFNHLNLASVAAKHSSRNSAYAPHHHGHPLHGRHHSNHSDSAAASADHSNARLDQAFLALQAWKRVMYSDPHNFTSDWKDRSVCNYKGVFCAPAPDDPNIQVVAGIDLNKANIAGFLPEELGLLSDLALIHLNSNRFCGILPQSLANLTVLHELDISNNRFVGPFPNVVLSLPGLKYLDLRYNEFEGPLPPTLFSSIVQLDAIFVNNNRFTSINIPASSLSSSASVVVFANNNFSGCLPPSIANFANTLEELLLINTSLSGCLPPQVSFLYKLRVLDVSNNNLIGPIPYSLAGLAHLELLNLANNMMTGAVPAGVCSLPNLANFTISYNYFCEEDGRNPKARLHLMIVATVCLRGHRRNVMLLLRTLSTAFNIPVLNKWCTSISKRPCSCRSSPGSRPPSYTSYNNKTRIIDLM